MDRMPGASCMKSYAVRHRTDTVALPRNVRDSPHIPCRSGVRHRLSACPGSSTHGGDATAARAHWQGAHSRPSTRDSTMTRAHAKRLEQDLLSERARLQREIEQLTTPPRDASEVRGRFGDDEVTSTAGTSAEVDDALAVRASRELDDVDRALVQLHEDPDHFGLCATCA